jgi:hypothetical protein
VYVRDTYILLLHALYIGYALTSEVVSESKYSIKPSHATAASVLSVVGECVSIVYQRLSFFFRRETTGLLLVWYFCLVYTPATVRSVLSTSTLRGVHALDPQ